MFELPQLPYSFDSLEPHIDALTMQIHHDKHHQTYVDNLNNILKDLPEFLSFSIEEILTNLDKFPQEIRQKVRNNAGGHFNHSLFWNFMTPKFNEETKIPAQIASLEDEFKTKALGRFGSGWAWIVKDGQELKVIDTPNQDNPIMDNPNLKIVLGLDVWEHAYYLKYQNKRSDYINSWWNIVNWELVEHKL